MLVGTRRAVSPHEIIILKLFQYSLIGSTKTSKGLTVDCVVDVNSYEKAIKISDTDLDSVNIYHHLFHGDWNYTIFPNSFNPKL